MDLQTINKGHVAIHITNHDLGRNGKVHGNTQISCFLLDVSVELNVRIYKKKNELQAFYDGKLLNFSRLPFLFLSYKSIGRPSSGRNPDNKYKLASYVLNSNSLH